MLARMKLQTTDANIGLLMRFFDAYLVLTEEEEEMVLKEVQKLDNTDDVMAFPISLVEKGRAEGIEQGKEAIIIDLLTKQIMTEHEIVEKLSITKEQLASIKQKMEK